MKGILISRDKRVKNAIVCSHGKTVVIPKSTYFHYNNGAWIAQVTLQGHNHIFALTKPEKGLYTEV